MVRFVGYLSLSEKLNEKAMMDSEQFKVKRRQKSIPCPASGFSMTINRGNYSSTPAYCTSKAGRHREVIMTWI
jgi:hypothetical protein